MGCNNSVYEYHKNHLFMNFINFMKRIPSENFDILARYFLSNIFVLFSDSNINSNFSFLLYVLCAGKEGTVKKR